MENNDTLEVIQRIPLDKLRPYPDHPFGVRDDDMMKQTVEILDSGCSCSITHSVSCTRACARFYHAYAGWFVLQHQIPLLQRGMRPIHCM